MKTLLAWKAPEYYYREKSADWYWAVGIISISAAATAIIFNNIVFGILILIGSFTLTIYAARRPKTVQFEIRDNGIVLDTLVYPYDALESFWIEEDHFPAPKLLVKSKKTIVPLIIIPLAGVSVESVDKEISAHLPKTKFSEPTLHLVMEHLGF